MVQTYLLAVSLLGIVTGMMLIIRNLKLSVMFGTSILVAGIFSALYIPVYTEFVIVFTMQSFADFILPVFVERALMILAAIYIYMFAISWFEKKRRLKKNGREKHRRNSR